MDFYSEWKDLLEVSQNGFLIPISDIKLTNLTIEESIVKNAAGDTILHVAARRCSVKLLSKLLKYSNSLNSQGDMGYTPLHYAAEAGKSENYDLLVSAGSNPNIRDDFGDLPLDLFPE